MPADVGDLRVNRNLVIPAAELDWRFSASGGPGGQHANTANTKADLRFNVTDSPSLGPVQRQRILDKLGPEVRVVSSRFRSQLRNRDDAIERLGEVLAEALTVQTARHATRPSGAAKRRRLADKKARGEAKRGRQRPTSTE